MVSKPDYEPALQVQRYAAKTLLGPPLKNSDVVFYCIIWYYIVLYRIVLYIVIDSPEREWRINMLA